MQAFEQMITVPTRITEDNSTIFDHIYVSDESKVLEVSVPDISLSDHFPIGITWCLSSYKECTNMDRRHKLITHRDIKGLSVDTCSYIYDLVNANWPASGDHGNLDSQLNEFCELFQTVTDLHVPLKQKRVKRTLQPKWITREILDAIHKRDTLRRQGPFVEYRRYRNKVVSAIRSAKSHHYRRLILNASGDSGRPWHYMYLGELVTLT